MAQTPSAGAPGSVAAALPHSRRHPPLCRPGSSARRDRLPFAARPFGVKAYADDGQAGPVSRDSTQVPRVRRPPHGQGGRIQSKPEKPPFPLPPATAAAAQPRGAPCLRAVSGGRGTACSLPRSRPQQPPHPDGSSTSSTATAAKSVKTAVAAAAMLN